MKPKSFFFTCGQSHCHSLPNGKTWHKNNVLQVSAPDEFDARALVVLLYGMRWSNMYFDQSEVGPEYFPDGIVHRFQITPMEAFVIKLLEKEPGGSVRPGELKNLWIEEQGQRPYVASRDAFGQTASAYQCLYRMVKKGILQMRQPNHWDMFFTVQTVISSPVTNA